MNPKKVKTDRKFQAWPRTTTRCGCDKWVGVEITNYFSGLTNDLGQCYATLLSIHSSYYFLQGDLVQVEQPNRPSNGWCKLNIDGSALENPRRASRGGLFRDSNERWIKGFTQNIGLSTSVDAKLWTLRDGLTLCIALNILALEIRIDAKIVLDWISSESNCNLNHFSLIMDCKTLINQFANWRWVTVIGNPTSA